MAFSLRVWCSQRDECFSVPVPQAAIEAAELKVFIEASPTGKKLGFAAGDWNIFPASAAGLKEGGPLPLPFNHTFTPAAGSIVNVWAEPKPGAAAGEPWGPGSWAGWAWVLGWPGLSSHTAYVSPLLSLYFLQCLRLLLLPLLEPLVALLPLHLWPHLAA